MAIYLALNAALCARDRLLDLVDRADAFHLLRVIFGRFWR
jgi:hypothetical protein